MDLGSELAALVTGTGSRIGNFQLVEARVEDEDRAGACLLVTNKGGAEYWPATVTAPELEMRAINFRTYKPKEVLRSGLEALAQLEGPLLSLLTLVRRNSLLWSLSRAKRVYYSFLLTTGARAGARIANLKSYHVALR